MTLIFSMCITGFANSSIPTSNSPTVATSQETIVNTNTQETPNTTAPAVTVPAITIINPSAEIVYSKDLLVSLKVLEQKSLKVRVYKIEEKVTLVHGPVFFDTKPSLGFYTTQVNDITPGKYRITVDTLNENKKVIETIKKEITMQEAVPTPPSKIFEAPSSTTLQIFQSILKSIFGN